jgi:hypothetical protein
MQEPINQEIPSRRLFYVVDGDGLEFAAITIEQIGGEWWVERSPFINTWRVKMGDEQVELIVDAVEKEDWVTLDKVDPEFLPWYCRECGCNYAADKWNTWRKYDDDDGSWLDSIRGRCPKGHERMIAD